MAVDTINTGQGLPLVPGGGGFHHQSDTQLGGRWRTHHQHYAHKRMLKGASSIFLTSCPGPPGPPGPPRTTGVRMTVFLNKPASSQTETETETEREQNRTEPSPSNSINVPVPVSFPLPPYLTHAFPLIFSSTILLLLYLQRAFAAP